MASSATRPTPTPSWTGSFITLIGSNSPAKACAAPETGKPKRLDPTPILSNMKTRKPASLATRAASFRNPGRLHVVLPGQLRRNRHSHQPFRRRERAMQRFRSVKTLQKFSSVHAQVHNHFNQERHLVTRQVYKQRRSAALAEWRALAA